MFNYHSSVSSQHW